MPAGEDHHPGGRGGSCAGGRRGLDPASWNRQDRPQEPGSDAHQRPGKVQITYEQLTARRRTKSLFIQTACQCVNICLQMKHWEKRSPAPDISFYSTGVAAEAALVFLLQLSALSILGLLEANPSSSCSLCLHTAQTSESSESSTFGHFVSMVSLLWRKRMWPVVSKILACASAPNTLFLLDVCRSCSCTGRLAYSAVLDL